MRSSINITDLILKEQIIEQHFKDELTGFGNREALFHRLRLDKSAKLLVLINLVGFSEINDYLGYDVGDELLKQINLVKQIIFYYLCSYLCTQIYNQKGNFIF